MQDDDAGGGCDPHVTAILSQDRGRIEAAIADGIRRELDEPVVLVIDLSDEAGRRMARPLLGPEEMGSVLAMCRRTRLIPTYIMVVERALILSMFPRITDDFRWTLEPGIYYAVVYAAGWVTVSTARLRLRPWWRFW